jgi:hypothetical protein
MTDEKLTQSEEIALWKRATGYDDPEVLDSFLGRNGVLRNFDVLNEMLADANKEKFLLRALLKEASEVVETVAESGNKDWELLQKIKAALNGNH